MKTNNRLSIIILLLFCGTMATAQTVFRGTVIDAVTKQPIVNARVGINNQGVGEITNAKGFFNYRKHHEVLNSESELQVGATGYASIRLDAEEVRTLFNMSSKIELQPSSKQQKKKAVNDLTVFWDVSEDMQGRDVDAEIAYIKEYVSAYKNVTLRLVIFDYQIRSEERIEIRGGDMTRFRESVKGLIYNGPSNYDVLGIKDADAVILSSNGNPNYGTLAVSQNIPVYAIASETVTVKDEYMNSLALYTQGGFMRLQAYNGISSQETVAAQETKRTKGPTIQGTITSFGKPLQEVSIIKKGAVTEYLTKADGSFELPAIKGDILQIRYLGMYPKEVLVPDQKNIDVELLPENDVLDEVVLEKKIEKIIVGNKEIRGRKVSPHIPGGVTSLGDFYITSEDIKPNARSIEQVIKDHFKRIWISYTWKGVKLTVNGASPNFYLDNRPVSQDIALSVVDKDIESVIVKESKFVETSRYGGIPVSGIAVIITTKSSPLVKEKRERSALVKGNEYTEEIQSISGGIVTSTSQVKGKVTSLGKPIQGATITKKGSFDEIASAADGSFTITVSEGDILSIKYLGMYSKYVVVEDITQIMDINLFPKNDLLDEVVVTGDAKIVEPEVAGPIVERGQYKLGKSVFNVITLTRDDFNFDHFANIEDGLDGKLAGVDKKNGKLLVRGEEPFYFIDGQLVDVFQFSNLNPAIIESISVKKQYGNVAGVNGRAILVNTNQFIDPSVKPPSPLVEGNDYEENISTIGNSIDFQTQITGIITSEGNPIQGAIITKKGTFEEYTSKVDGSFNLPANEGDQLVVYYLGMYPKGFLVDEKTAYTVDLISKNDVLDEVVLNGENKSERLKKLEAIDEDYKKKPYSARVITQDEIAKLSTHNIYDLISNRFSGVEAKGVYKEQILLNPRSATNAPFGVLLDGVLYDQQILTVIEIATVAKIEVINSAFASAAGQGGGGVIKITTISYSNSNVENKEIPSALVEGNDYTEEVTSIGTTTLNQSSKLQVTGIVKDLKGFLADATITRKGSFDEVYTDAQGRFEIRASLGDVLVVSKVGMFAKEALIESQNMGTIALTPKNDELDEVIVAGDKRVDNTIESSDGRRVNKDKLGYAAAEITENDFSAGATNLRQLMTGKVSGVTVEGGLYSGSQVVYKIRGGNQSITNQIPPIWIVNGTPYQDPPDFLDVQQIGSITVLKSASATSRYGSLAAGGAFLVKTKEVSFENKAKKAQKSALVSGNEYTESSTRTIDASSLPEYILRLREIPNLKDQFELYQRMSRTQESPLEFYVDVAQYFDGIHKELADKVRADLAYISRNNTKALRTLCYIYEAAGDYDKAALVYERILKVAPSEAQSYRDLALVYQEIGKYNEALELYYNMLGEQIKGVNFKGIEKTLKNELSHLLALHKDQVDYARFPNEWLRTDFDIDIRMVIDWSDRTVPFEFQFVNPEKKFFKWTHTLEESRDRLEEEQAQGYQTEEFIIDDAPPGEWLINIQYLGDEGDYVLPPFLKYTVYKNYGTPQETKEIKVVKLFKQSDKVTLGKVVL